jgi:Fis family transcriptional regulator
MEVVKAPPSLNEQLNAFVCSLIEQGITRDEAAKEFERLYIVQLLVRNRGNQCKAAREGGIHRNTVSRAIAEHKIDMRRLREIVSGRRMTVSTGHAGMLLAKAG